MKKNRFFRSDVVIFLAFVLSVFSMTGCVNYEKYYEKYEPKNFEMEFGVLEWDTKGNTVVRQVDTIPYVTGRIPQTFGYLIKPLSSPQFSYHAKVLVPGKSKLVQGEVEEIQEQADSFSYTSNIAHGNGASRFEMWLNPGDPKGVYRVQLFINNELADEREFIVE
ncbi:hypothetical protein BTA51_28450 [Hahella sp. CCB-MM4]|uniref:hypothetical protein n=1 Tax=Hahella sp. (strain CCB-MM4) TaxID=1926491 RepID=UPI000B9B6A01|nr:hypothetical protein [Hahella sp. CCB-MM4]OZG69970.1 hypothetical protein BTA51_28450 [Hahella sp. CCB-MM4]